MPVFFTAKVKVFSDGQVKDCNSDSHVALTFNPGSPTGPISPSTPGTPCKVWKGKEIFGLHTITIGLYYHRWIKTCKYLKQNTSGPCSPSGPASPEGPFGP